LRKIIFLLLISQTFLFAGSQINNFKLKDLNNRQKSFNDLRGEKLTLVDFWATWCKPCIQAIPKLNKIYSEYKDKGVEIIGVNADSPRNSAKIKPFAKTYKIKYPILRDPNNEVTSELNVTAFPTLYIINSKNEIVYTHIGFRPGDEKLLISEVDKLLGEENDSE
jgi:thiol-disulfide isomerase/thioredoxin